MYRKSNGQEAQLRHLVHNLIDTKSRIILATGSSLANGTAERVVSQEQIRRFGFVHPQVQIKTLSADKAYPAAEYLKQLKEQGIIPLIPQRYSEMEEVPTWKRRASSPERQLKRDANMFMLRQKPYMDWTEPEAVVGKRWTIRRF